MDCDHACNQYNPYNQRLYFFLFSPFEARPIDLNRAPRGATVPREGKGEKAELLLPEAQGEDASLRPSPRDGWGPEELGGAEGPLARSLRQTPCRHGR